MNKPQTDILAIMAHPDDELLCAGVIRHHTRHGRSVVIAVSTNGEGGPPAFDVNMAPQAIVPLRRDELMNSAKVLGVRQVEFLGFPDTYEEAQIAGYIDEITRKIRETIQKYNPRIVLTHGPDGEYGHPQHKAVSRCTTEAVAQTERERRPLLYYCNAYDSDDPLPRSNISIKANYVFPVTGGNYEARRSVMRCHVSQMQCFLGYFGRNMQRECYHRVGEPNEHATWFEVVLD